MKTWVFRSQYLLLCCIAILGLFLRIYKVSSIPPSLSWDEVSIGYNAYSILKTGKDEHGRFLPVDTFVAYGDYKPPLSIYATIPSVALFGLNEFAVRLPSVLAGFLTIFVTFFLVRELFPERKNLPLLSSFLLAISPWHIQLSRGGFEANIGTFLIVLGVWLVFVARRKSKFFLVCWLPFAAAIYTFNSARYFAPIFGFFLLIGQWSSMQKQKKYFLLGCIIAFLSLLPILPHMFSKEARLRFAEVNIFTDLKIVVTANDRIALDHNAWWAKILHNRRFGYARSYLIHFFDQLEPWFLFVRGDGNPKFSIQDVGQLYLVELPFLLLGIYSIFKNHRSIGWLLLFWIVAAIVPAATARETPHALRIENSLPVWQIFIAFGIGELILHARPRYRTIMIGSITFSYVVVISLYLHAYYRHYAQEFSGEWQFGYREAIRYVEAHGSRYKKIVLTESIGRPYMYVLFYKQYDPEQFWQTRDASFDAAGFYHVYGFDRYRFVREGGIEREDDVLYVLRPQDVPAGGNILQTITQLNGNPVLVIWAK